MAGQKEARRADGPLGSGTGIMNEAKDCNRRLAARLVACLGLTFCTLEAGCSTFGGLHSVGTWPPFAHLWERGPGSPSPENDTYAQAMRPQLGLDTKLADASRRRGMRTDDDRAAGASDGGSRSTAIAGADEGESGPERTGGQGVRVTLGRPEPLRGLSPAADSEQTRVASAGSSTWRPAGADFDGGDAPALAGPTPVLAADEPLPDEAPRGPALESASQGLSVATTDPLPAQFALAGPTEAEPAAALVEPAEAAPRPSKEDAKRILAQAAEKLDRLNAYQVKMQRRERVGGSVLPEEEVLLSIRRKPKAVRLEWTSGSSKGREVIFSPALDAKMIYVHQPQTSAVVPSVKIAVDSPLVMKNSRHTIAEAGFEMILANLQKSGDDPDGSKAGAPSLDYKGLEKAAGLDTACHHFVRHAASGETWNVYLDPRSLLPRLVLAENKKGDLLERYVYSEIRENPKELAAADAFSPSERWGEGKGLFSRIAKAASGLSVPGNKAPTTR
jgi:Protein of unknown function (DUF1571)